MSSSTHNDLQSGQKNSESRSIVVPLSNPHNEDRAQGIEPDTPATNVAERYLHPPPPRKHVMFPLPLLPEGITLKELITIKLTAQFVGFYGMFFREDLMKSVSSNPLYESQFQFTNHGDSRFSVYCQLVIVYSCVYVDSKKLKNPRFGGASSVPFLECLFNILGQVLQKGKQEEVDMAMIDLRAVECLFNMEEYIQPDAGGYLQLPAPPREPTMLVLPEGITLKQLNIIRLTAQFLAFFGMDLMKSVFEKPEFNLPVANMLQHGSVSHFFNRLYSMYKRVLKPPLSNRFTSREAVLEFFSKLLGQVLEAKEDVGVEMAMIELHAFEYFANFEWMKSPENLSILRNPPPQIQPPLGSQPDSTTIRVSVPNLKDGQVIKITVKTWQIS